MPTKLGEGIDWAGDGRPAAEQKIAAALAAIGEALSAMGRTAPAPAITATSTVVADPRAAWMARIRPAVEAVAATQRQRMNLHDLREHVAALMTLGALLKPGPGVPRPEWNRIMTALEDYVQKLAHNLNTALIDRGLQGPA